MTHPGTGAVPLVRLRDVTKTYPAAKGRNEVNAVVDVDLDIAAGDVQAIVGYSGAGKSTLVRLLNGLEPATSGSIQVGGTELVGLRERQLRPIRLGIGMIFQQFNLLESRTVWGNLAYPLQIAGVDKAEQQRRISELLHFVGLPDKAHTYPRNLSGGQKQRVGIARALTTNPSLLLADEATSALDPETTHEVLRLLKRVNEEFGTTIVAITHEMEVVRELADHVAVMESGRIVESGPVYDVFSAPRQPVTRRFVGTVVDDEPSTDALAALRSRHPGRFVKVELREGGPRQTDIFAVLLERGIAFELVFGGIEEIQGATFGNLTLSLDGPATSVDEAVRELAALVPAKEL
ncbi:methionine ABC transporter ATP-binding protein [Nocardioides sp.]|uniref:methionine ABC transporter ATP-binding protein n=1 Tax=Nocardioides sp. TaxID=35761 RepID=UPI00198FAAA7|nr:methionine ABC transporter ATP-binding protein [Nocardioides sp.]MBC7277998.1 methionine ABC transporter ATP-binding protein [Nocardioides sp.]